MSDYYVRNKRRYIQRAQQWAEKNPHKVIASQHQNKVREKHPHLFHDGDITSKDLAGFVLVRKDEECPYCTYPAVRIDHPIPLSKGGTYTWDNIELICETCYLAKACSTKEEFIEWIYSLIETFIEGDK